MRVTEQATIAASSLAQPLVTYTVGKKEWEVAADYRYVYRHPDTTYTTRITVPAGFCCDLSSIPRALWWLIGPHELSIVAPLLHDWLYRHGGSPPVGCTWPIRSFTRSEADRLFFDAMREEGVTAWRRHVAYRAVRMFGGGAWKSPPPAAPMQAAA